MHETSPWHPDGTGNIDAAAEPPASKQSPIVQFAYATGLNAQTYQPLLERFSRQFRVAVWDMRGHGHSPFPAIDAGFEGWKTLERDLEEVVVKLGEKVHLVGHSIGATLSIMLAARRPDIVASVAALEPSSISNADRLQVEICRAQGGVYDFDKARAAARRRSRWRSREEAKASYAGRGMFKTRPDVFLENYLEAGLQDAGDGGLRLSCEPAWEAAIFAAVTTSIWRSLPELKVPLLMVRGTVDTMISDVDATHFVRLSKHLRDVRIEGSTHFLPMEETALVANEVSQHILKHS